MHAEIKDGKALLVCTIGGTVLLKGARCIADLRGTLQRARDWVELGGADEQKPAKAGAAKAWRRSEISPDGGWYGLKKGLAAGSGSMCHR